MPIFMDLHIIPGVKAKDVAEAHRHDLLIQREFNCTCMTYWIDESRNSVFCLIEAPNAQAVRDLHNKAHGLAPHKIIPVNKTLVESFLGRIYDPHVDGVQEGELKIFNDPAFRILVLTEISDPVLLDFKLGNKGRELIGRYRDYLQQKTEEFQGEIVNHSEKVTNILSFASANNAIECAVAIKNKFSKKEREILALKVTINAGVPVAESRRIFGDTIDFGKKMLYVVQQDRIAVASIIKKVTDLNFLEKIEYEISGLSSSEEKFLAQLLTVLDYNIGNENLGVHDLCEQLAISKSGLNRTTQALTGNTPNNLIKKFRLNKALELLREKNYPIAQIAFIAGFGSPSYFSKCFKEHFGIPPSLFMTNLDQKKL